MELGVHLEKYYGTGDDNMLNFFKAKRPEYQQMDRGSQATSQAMTCEGQSNIRSEIQVLPDNELRQMERTSLNRLPDLSDWEPGSRQTDLMRDLGQPICIHRKSWEYGLALEGLERLGAVKENARALAIGAGSEPPLFYYANRIGKMVATDLYDNPDHEGTPAMLEDPSSFAPFEYRRDHLDVLAMPGDKLDFIDESFDFAFCLSSIEHFGSRETQRRSLAETARVLKPGGIYCCITELILTEGHTHTEYFSFEEMQEIFFNDNGFELVGGEPDYRIIQVFSRLPNDYTVSKHTTKPACRFGAERNEVDVF